ncbi:MAG: hypothetical protein ACU837_06605 [Gammaproteobacteria bacterium]
MIVLTLVGMVAGVPSIANVCAVWSDRVLRKIAGWLKLPVETTVSRVFKELTAEQIALLEAANHTLRGRMWRRAQRAVTSKVGIGSVQWID